MRDTSYWYNVIKEFAEEMGISITNSFNAIYNSDDEMTDEQFDELVEIFEREKIHVFDSIEFLRLLKL